MNTRKYSSIHAQWRVETFWALNKTIRASVPFVLLSCEFCCRLYQETLPYIVSDALPPRVVISTWSTKVRLTFQFSRWQVEAELGSLILYLFLWCVWPVRENKEFSPKYLPWLWVQSTEQSTRRLGTYLSFKKKHTAHWAAASTVVNQSDEKIKCDPKLTADCSQLVGSQRAGGPELTSVCLLCMKGDAVINNKNPTRAAYEDGVKIAD